MSWMRQGRYFVLVGVLQWLVDWSMTVALSHIGVHLAYANVAGRASGALLGFWLNGSITFTSDRKTVPGWRALARYIVLWCAMALLSTLAVMEINVLFGLRGALLGKPVVDIVLATCSFLAARYWVFR